MSRRRLLMTTDAVGGVWTHALDLSAGLFAHGIDTDLAILGPPPAPDQVLRAAAIPGLTLHRTGLPLAWLADTAGQVLEAGRALAALAAERRADLVHLHDASLAAAGVFALPVTATCHSCVKTWWEAVRAGPLPDHLAWRADLVARGYAAARSLVAPTHAFAAATRRSYRLAHPPVVVPNGRRHPRDPVTPAAATSDFVFTAGRLWDPGKNLAALDRVAARLPWPVLAAGPAEGPDGSHIALPHLRGLGRLDEAGIAGWLAARPLFVSLARYEPFGLAVLEAAQAGCALILSDTPGFRELWEGAALFVDPDDTAGAVAIVHRLMRDPGERRRLEAAAARRAGRTSAAAMAAGMAALLLPGPAVARRVAEAGAR